MKVGRPRPLEGGFAGRLSTLVILGVLCLSVSAVLFVSQAPVKEAREEPDSRVVDVTLPRPSQPPPKPEPRAREVYAAWYAVPSDSLAKRRAGDELTAAHNSLPIGTRVRITHMQNGKSVVVRITDRGIRDRRVKIDVCKEAAEELEMLDKGIARVRMQVLREEPLPAAASDGG